MFPNPFFNIKIILKFQEVTALDFGNEVIVQIMG